MKAAIVCMLTDNKEKELHEMLRYAEIPDEIREEWAEKTITRAIERGCKIAVPLAWLEWANKWLSGDDRTAETAMETRSQLEASCCTATPSMMLLQHTIAAAKMLDNPEGDYLRNNAKYKYISTYCVRCADWSVAWVNNHNVSRRIMYAEITKQLDDLIELIEVYKEEPEESISDKLFNAAETDLERAVAEMAGERGEDCAAFIEDVLSGGCANGTVGELIYYNDTVTFYRKHKKDIQKLVTELMSDCGEVSLKGLFGDKFDNDDIFCEDFSNQNLLAWFGFEEALRTLAYRIELDI